MEEIINRLSKAVATYSFEATNYPNCIVFREDLENLINKYKEQEEQIEEYKLNVKEAIHEAQENARIFRKEQAKVNEYRKIVELMAKELAVCGGFDYVEFGMSTGDFNKDIKNMIDYFKKKAKGE